MKLVELKRAMGPNLSKPNRLYENEYTALFNSFDLHRWVAGVFLFVHCSVKPVDFRAIDKFTRPLLIISVGQTPPLGDVAVFALRNAFLIQHNLYGLLEKTNLVPWTTKKANVSNTNFISFNILLFSCWICATPHLQFSLRWYLGSRESPYAPQPVSHTFPQRCLSNSSNVCLIYWRWPFLVLSRKNVQHSFFLLLSPPGDRWRDASGFEPAGSVWSCSVCLSV